MKKVREVSLHLIGPHGVEVTFLSQLECLTPPPKDSVINSSQVQVRKVRELDLLRKKAALGWKKARCPKVATLAAAA